MNWRLFSNSLVLSTLASLLAGLSGCVVALTLVGSAPGWRRGIWLCAIVALALPPFLVTNSWLDLLGAQGVFHSLLNVYSLSGATFLLALLTWPITALFVAGAWSRLEAPLLEVDPAFRGLKLLRWLLWPMARVAIGQAFVLTFVLALNSFSIPVILQVPVLPEDLWLAFSTRLNDAGAAWAAWPMVVVPIVVLLVLRRSEISWPRTEGTAAAAALRRGMGPRVFKTGACVTVLLLVLSLGVPLVQLAASTRTWIELPKLLLASPDVILNSFFCAAATATLCVTIGFLLRSRSLGGVTWVFFFIPGVLMGRAAIAVFNGTVLYPSIGLVILLFAIRFFAISWSGVSMAVRSVDRDLMDAARVSGARGWVLFRHVYWPQLSGPVAGTWYVVYLLSLWDVETLVLVQPPGGETLALRIFNMLHYGHNGQVNATCVALLALAVGPLVVWQAGRWLLGRVNARVESSSSPNPNLNPNPNL